MRIALENPEKLDLSPPIQPLLETMFADYRRIIVKKEFGGGFSGGRVLEVQPIKSDGTPELPLVVKLAAISLIQKEWTAYRQHIQNRLPYAATLRDEPVLLPEAGWGGLRYTLMGGSTFEVMSLRDYCRRLDVTAQTAGVVLERLLKIMRPIWQHHYISPKFQLRTSYDSLLPVNLLIEARPALPDGPLYRLTPDSALWQPPQVGDRVCVSGFAVVKTNPTTQTITLNRPNIAPEIPSYYLRCKMPAPDEVAGYRMHQIIDSFAGEVKETRLSKLTHEIQQAFDGRIDLMGPVVYSMDSAGLPNPLHAVDNILNQTREVNIASIHGDFNLENILIEPETGIIHLIDFADAREDHVLHDLLRLETEIVTRLIPEMLHRHDLAPLPALAALYWPLHLAWPGESQQPVLPHPALEKAWMMLTMLRKVARDYLNRADDVTEYYQGLIIYLLGALKFKNLNQMAEYPLPKQAAFWAAALIRLLSTESLEQAKAPPALAALLLDLPEAPPLRVASQAPVALTLAEATQKLTSLPLDVIPPLASLPPKSRMSLSRNPMFVGRQRDLKALARALKGSETVVIGQVETAAATGMGGIGKTQLASEFVHHYGQYFAGGVFWLSFADPNAIPAEIAACGGVGTLDLRPNFGELSLDDQVSLVKAAWQEPVPRLLVFDNCEDPSLAAKWRPSSGGCRILLTSRRLDWEPHLGVQPLPVDVLSRQESMALLRQHQPDADDQTLNDVAEELGDLPLALHLAGSYLARYRRIITPAQYLAQLRDPNLLQHRSLQGSWASPTGHVQNVYRTIALSYNRLDPTDSVDR